MQCMKVARILREETGLSLWDVAVGTGVDPSRLSKFETGRYKEIGYRDMKKLAELYTKILERPISIDDLLEGIR